MDQHYGWPKHDPSQGAPPASSAASGIQPPQPPPPQPPYAAMRPGPPVPPPLRTLGIPSARPPYPYATTVPGGIGKSSNPIPAPARSHLVHPHPRQHGMYHPMPPPAPAPHSYYQSPYTPQPPPAQPGYPIEYTTYRQPPPLRAPRQQEPSRQPPPPQPIKRIMTAPSHLTPRHLGAATQLPAVHEPPQSTNMQASSLPGPITSAPSAIPRSVSQPIPMDNPGQQPLSISSAPLPNSQRLQPVGHTVGGQRPTHHPVGAGPPADSARAENHIGNTAGPQVGMVSDPQLAQNGAQGGDRNNGFRQLKVEDALLYLEQVKSQFTDQPAVYNQFLDIMKEFKAQSIDTAEVIKRVSTLFDGHRGLILGFNTFLPPGYKIELRDDPATGRFTTGYVAPGGQYSMLPGSAHPAVSAIQNQQQQQPMVQQTAQSHHLQGRNPYQSLTNAHQGSVQHQNPYSHGRLPAPGQTQPQQMQHLNGAAMGQHGTTMSMNPGPGVSQRGNQQMDTHPSAQLLAGQQHNQDGAAAALVNRFGGTRGVDPAPTGAEKPIEFNQAVNYVNKIKSRFSDNEAVYKSFLDILQTYQKEQRTIKQVYKQVSELFRDHQDLLNEFSHFLPEAQPVANRMAMEANAQYMRQSMKVMDGVEYAAVAGNGRGPNSYAGSQLQGRGNLGRGNGNIPGAKTGDFMTSMLAHSNRKNVNTTSSDTVRKNRKSSSRKYQDAEMAPSAVLSFFAEVREQLGESGDRNYKELIKILNLVLQEVISVDELPKLLEGLFDKHKNLYAAFKVFINHADSNAAERALALLQDGNDNFASAVRKGPLARVEDVARLNEKYKKQRLSMVARKHGEDIDGVTGYRKYPKDLGGVQCSGMTEGDRSVLNFEAASIPNAWGDDEDGKLWQTMLSEKRKDRASALDLPDTTPNGDGAPQSPTAVLQRQTPYGIDCKETVEDQRAEFDVLIGCCASAVLKLEMMMQGDRGYKILSQRDWYAIKVIYADSFSQFETLLKNNNEHAIKSVHNRLEGRRKEWVESQKLMEKVWRTYRYSSTNEPKNYTRNELLAASEIEKESQLHHDMDNRKVVDDLIWFMLEWTVDTPEMADEMMDVVHRVYKLLSNEDSFAADEHLYYLVKLLAIVSDVAHWLVKRPTALVKTIGMVQQMLEGAKNVVEFEEYCKKTYEKEGWEQILPDFIVILKKLLIAVKKAPSRKSLMGALERAEAKEKEWNDSAEEEKKMGRCTIRVLVKKTSNDDDASTTLKFEKMEKEGADDDKRVQKKKNKTTNLVRYMERMAEKQKKRKRDDNDNSNKDKGNESGTENDKMKKAKTVCISIEGKKNMEVC